MRAGDIGHHFPDSDPAFEGVSSLVLLRQVAGLMREQGFELVDLDAVLILEEPRISPYRDAMRRAMAEALGVQADRVGVKATTTEGLGATGRREGAAAHAVALLARVG
jgi:2-C-methyl-D-erythritol 2,4-cyclodiphosphate synthase